MLSAIWTKLPTPITWGGRSSHAMAIVKDMAYLFGGEQEPRKPIDGKLHVYDLIENKFVDIHEHGTPPSARVGLGMAAIKDNLYVLGGRGGKDMTPLAPELFTFSTTLNEWKVVDIKDNTTIPEGRSYHALIALDNMLYLHAGCLKSGRAKDLYVLDPDNPQWIKLPEAPGSARGGTVLAAFDHSLVRFGGFDGQEIGDGIDVFDTRSHEWIRKHGKGLEVEKEPQPRSVHGLHVLSDSRLVLLHGEGEPASVALGHDGAGKFLSDVWLWDETNGWSCADIKGDKTPEPRGWFASATWKDNKIVVSGGLNDKNERLDDLWLLTIT